MSSTSYASYRLNDNIRLNESLSDIIISLELLASSEEADISKKELEDAVDSGRTLLQGIRKSLDGEDVSYPVIVELGHQLCNRKKGRPPVKEMIERGLADIEEQRWNDAKSIFKEIQNVSEQISDERLEKSMYL